MKLTNFKIIKYMVVVFVIFAVFLYPRFIKYNHIFLAKFMVPISKEINKYLKFINPKFKLAESKLVNYFFFLLYLFLGLFVHSLLKNRINKKCISLSVSLLICVFLSLINEFTLEKNYILNFTGAGMILFLNFGSFIGIYLNSLFKFKYKKKLKGKNNKL